MQRLQLFAAVAAERNVLASDVSVARFQLLNEATLRLIAVAQETVFTDVIRQHGKEQGVATEATERDEPFL